MAIHRTAVEFTAKAFIAFTLTRITLMRTAPGLTVRPAEAPSIRNNSRAWRAWSGVAKQEAGVLAAGVVI